MWCGGNLVHTCSQESMRCVHYNTLILEYHILLDKKTRLVDRQGAECGSLLTHLCTYNVLNMMHHMERRYCRIV